MVHQRPAGQNPSVVKSSRVEREAIMVRSLGFLERRDARRGHPEEQEAELRNEKEKGFMYTRFFADMKNEKSKCKPPREVSVKEQYLVSWWTSSRSAA